MNFIGVTLVNEIIQVSSAQVHVKTICVLHWVFTTGVRAPSITTCVAQTARSLNVPDTSLSRSRGALSSPSPSLPGGPLQLSPFCPHTGPQETPSALKCSIHLVSVSQTGRRHPNPCPCGTCIWFRSRQAGNKSQEQM